MTALQIIDNLRLPVATLATYAETDVLTRSEMLGTLKMLAPLWEATNEGLDRDDKKCEAARETEKLKRLIPKGAIIPPFEE